MKVNKLEIKVEIGDGTGRWMKGQASHGLITLAMPPPIPPLYPAYPK